MLAHSGAEQLVLLYFALSSELPWTHEHCSMPESKGGVQLKAMPLPLFFWTGAARNLSRVYESSSHHNTSGAGFMALRELLPSKPLLPLRLPDFPFPHHPRTSRRTMRAIRKISLCFIIASLFVTLAWLPATAGDPLIDNEVSDLTTKTLLTVPAKHTYSATSMIVTNLNAVSSDDARLLRSDSAVIGFVAVPANSTVQVQFNPPIVFKAGHTRQYEKFNSYAPV